MAKPEKTCHGEIREKKRDSPAEKLEIPIGVDQSTYTHDFWKYYHCTLVPFIT
jgi:hypothetical protein